MRSDQTFVHLHRALQFAFDWDDDHLYTFWLGTKFWPRAGTEFCNPFSFENPSSLAAFFAGERPRKRSAETRLDRARLLRGEKLAYVFDFGDEWRVLLTLKTIRADDGRPPAGLRGSVRPRRQYAGHGRRRRRGPDLERGLPGQPPAGRVRHRERIPYQAAMG